jgi:cyclophilin family peptidyl-prolyl cis-trans isomerase
MMRALRLVALAAAAALVAGVGTATTARAADPVVVLETAKGTIEVTFFQADAPKSVAHILDLVRQNYYRGQRFHRVEAALVQFGDKQTRDMSRRDYWGNGNSGRPIGVFELSKTHKHVRGAVGLGHSGNPANADSQMYIMKRAGSSLDGKYAVIGQVTSGMAVVDKIVVTDLIKNVYLK